MRFKLFLGALTALLFVASDALAVDTTEYPATLMDSTCTDSYNVVGGWGIGTTFVQTSGSPDLLCDHDKRILEGSLVADAIFGPFKRGAGRLGVRIFVDADAVSNDTDTWNIEVLALRPHEAVYDVVQTEQHNTEGNKITSFGPALMYSAAGATGSNRNCAIPSVFYIRLNLETATTWDGNISWYQY